MVQDSFVKLGISVKVPDVFNFKRYIKPAEIAQRGIVGITSPWNQ